MELQSASRTNTKIKMVLQGPCSSGKTYSALLIAYGICGSWERISVIDTENGSSHLYAHFGSFRVLSLGSPYSPEAYHANPTELEVLRKVTLLNIEWLDIKASGQFNWQSAINRSSGLLIHW